MRRKTSLSATCMCWPGSSTRACDRLSWEKHGGVVLQAAMDADKAQGGSSAMVSANRNSV